MAVFGERASARAVPFDELGGIQREVLPHAGIADRRAPPPPVATEAS